jgi:hypothetical protein
MVNIYTYNPVNLTSDENGIVKSVDFTVTVSDGTDEFVVNGHTALNSPPDTPIPYSQLTESEVIVWIKDLVGDNMQELADNELVAFKIRKANQLTSGTPW